MHIDFADFVLITVQLNNVAGFDLGSFRHDGLNREVGNEPRNPAILALRFAMATVIHSVAEVLSWKFADLIHAVFEPPIGIPGSGKDF
jgi:hypothetical protein